MLELRSRLDSMDLGLSVWGFNRETVNHTIIAKDSSSICVVRHGDTVGDHGRPGPKIPLDSEQTGLSNLRLTDCMLVTRIQAT